MAGNYVLSDLQARVRLVYTVSVYRDHRSQFQLCLQNAYMLQNVGLRDTLIFIFS